MCRSAKVTCCKAGVLAGRHHLFEQISELKKCNIQRIMYYLSLPF